MRSWRKLLYTLVLLVSAGVCVFGIRRGVRTDLFSLVGSNLKLDPVLSELSGKSADQMRVLCLKREDAAEVRRLYPFESAFDPTNLLEAVRTHGRGLLAPKSAELLRRGETDRIRRSAKRRDYTGFGLFPKADDPYYFLNDFVLALQALRPKGLPDGAEILTGSLGGDGRLSADLASVVDYARAHEDVYLSGAPFHTLLAQRRTICEINMLGALSLAGVLLLGFCLFRSPRFVLPTAATLASGFVMASAAVFALFGHPHAVTFLFGTTLIGLGVDYCYHALSSARKDPEFVRKLTSALLTTLLAFAPLLFAGVGALRQMAVFSMVGLVSIYVCVRVWFDGRDNASPSSGEEMAAPVRCATGLRLAALLGLAVSVVCVRPISVTSDPSAFYRPDALMARGEAKFAEMTGTASDLILVPLAEWQATNAVLKAKMDAEPKGDFLTAADLPSALTIRHAGQDCLVLPRVSAHAVVGDFADSCTSVNVRETLCQLFGWMTGMSFALVLVGLVLLGALLLRKGLAERRFPGEFLPPLGALLATLLVLAARGEPLTLFHVLCFFVLMGLGIDYAIFHRDDPPPATCRVVWYSFLTSLIGFGLLAFTSFPPTRMMGFTLAVGLFFAYVLSLPRARRTSKASDTWHAQREQSAGRLRLMLMWNLYRIGGKTLAKAVAFFVTLCAWPFAGVARRALMDNFAKAGLKGSPFRTVLNFAWSLLDKTDACTRAKNLPTMTVTGDTDWMKGGCFLLSTHIGCIEVLPALAGADTPRVHAFQQMSHDALFTELFARNLDPRRLALHAVEDIGVETAVEMQAAIARGEIVLMAGDRPSAGSTATMAHDFFGRPASWPKGVFRFAKLMEAPVYALTCVRTGWNAYRVRAVRLGEELLADYVTFLEDEVRASPNQWYQFYRVFA